GLLGNRLFLSGDLGRGFPSRSLLLGWRCLGSRLFLGRSLGRSFLRRNLLLGWRCLGSFLLLGRLLGGCLLRGLGLLRRGLLRSLGGSVGCGLFRFDRRFEFFASHFALGDFGLVEQEIDH